MLLDNSLGFALGNFLAGFALDAQRRNRPSFEPLDADLRTTFLAYAVLAVIQPLQCFLNLEYQFALAVPDKQHRIAVRFHGRAVRWIGKSFVMIHRFHGLAGFRSKLVDPLVEEITK